MVKIYTKTGDQGQTALGRIRRVAKDDPRIELLGEVDELTSLIGVICSLDISDALSRQLVELQKHFYELLGKLVDCSEFDSEMVTKKIELWIDEHSVELPELSSFIAPGGSHGAAFLQYARAVSRRVERKLLSVSKSEKQLEDILPFINRVSDYLFTIARRANLDNETLERELGSHE